ncbi:MAG: DNA polymerase III subunit delta [Actinobacteria bacterium]|nr:DNA polymerase III subunit delta [Actinomycetota bacterium]
MADQAELKPVYLLTGTDRPKIGRALQRLRARVGEDAVEHLDAPPATGDDAVTACNSLGFFSADARLVVVESVDKWKAADVKAITAYLESPAPGTVLALVAEDVKSDTALAKTVAKTGQVLAFSVVKRQLAQWVADQFKLAGARAEPEACAALVHLVGEDLHQLATEVDKLATWAAGEPIGEHEVEVLVAAVAETPTFALTDAWAQRDPARTLEASETIFEREGKARRDTAPRLAGALGNHVARVRQCQRLAAEGVRPRDAAGRLRMHPFYAEKVFAQARNFSEDELRDAVVRLAELDLALKGKSRVQPDLELQRALVDLSRAGGELRR